MNKIVIYAGILIAVFLLVVYYKGALSGMTNLTTGINEFIRTLQNRTSTTRPVPGSNTIY